MTSSTSSRSPVLNAESQSGSADAELGEKLARRLLDRDRAAVAEALNIADDSRPAQRRAALAMFDVLEREVSFPGAARVGVTGAPGAGKSSLLDAIVRVLRPRGETVAIVAIDPSSRTSGGALLGDRVRVKSGASDPGVFIRSMAARDQLGGLSESAWGAVTILAAAFDRVFIETVGVGQSETEIAALADSLIYVATPGAGDSLQFMKAGVLEFPDIFAVNKADVGALASQTASELHGGVSLSERDPATDPPAVVLTSVRDNTGIEELIACLDQHRARLIERGTLRDRRTQGRETQLIRSLERRYGSFGVEKIGGAEALRNRVRMADEGSAFSQLENLSQQIESALGIQ